MMRVAADTSDLERYIGVLRDKSLMFAAANGINETTKRLQSRSRQNIERRFTVRAATREFVLREGAKIFKFASPRQTEPFAELGVNNRPRFILPQFEAGNTRRSFVTGSTDVARPIVGSAARPTFGDSVPSALRYRALSLRPMLSATQRKAVRAIRGADRKETTRLRREARSSAGRGRPYQGKQRTYAIPGVGVFRRTGPKTSELLYAYDDDVRLPPSLRFVATAQAEGRGWLREETRKAIAKEIREARARGQL